MSRGAVPPGWSFGEVFTHASYVWCVEAAEPFQTRPFEILPGWLKVWRSSPGDEGAACLLVAKGQDCWKVKGLSSESICVQSLAPPNAAGWLKVCLDGSRVSATTQTTCDPYHAFTLWMLMGTHSCPGLLLLHSKCNNIQSFIGYLSASGYRLSVIWQRYDPSDDRRGTDPIDSEPDWFVVLQRNQTIEESRQRTDVCRGQMELADGQRRPTPPSYCPSSFTKAFSTNVWNAAMWRTEGTEPMGEWGDVAGHQPLYFSFHTQEMETQSLWICRKKLNKQAINK